MRCKEFSFTSSKDKEHGEFDTIELTVHHAGKDLLYSIQVGAQSLWITEHVGPGSGEPHTEAGIIDFDDHIAFEGRAKGPDTEPAPTVSLERGQSG